ncbi:hypothetical protein NEOLEDRAFT_1062733 [Neolentinus lepideus HHB14362 ss-1]|uniref:Uncharacterized protein n=1 Tax=Neolentinus lepideus HHB14362 ss-1 TaxID=1314782 RepID=A0A165TDN4_9AGAM|nr:hypothetical protein NEOLEDRAFT_1062733 [Neolentinus lepideus HHB14362 ss-1]
MVVSHRGFSAWISCEGRMLPEFEVAVDSKTHRVTSWIPSFEGKPFVVHWKDQGSKIDTAAYITLDGLTVAGRFLPGEGETYRDGVRTGPNMERPFVFSKVPEAGTFLLEVLGHINTHTRTRRDRWRKDSKQRRLGDYFAED